MAQTRAHIEATTRYESKAYDKIQVRVRKDSSLTRADIQKAADAAGESVNAYILKAIDMRMKSEL